jgi:endonuclease/exonuclease/phosphatase family metal-dependent hydrolase
MPVPHLKLICLNIEIDLHLDRIFPFFEKEKPDVVLLQEVLEKDLPLLESTLKMKSIFTPVAQFQWRESLQIEGQAIFTNLPLTKSYVEYYRGHKDVIPFIELVPGAAEKLARALSVIQVEKEGKNYCLATTHFTWTPDGKPSANQSQDLEILFDLLSSFPDVILCGDFNAPRGTPIFDKLATRYKDNIPPHVTTTIDKNWHKAGDLQLVVDGLFTTPHYNVDSIRLVDNLSDHFAIVANVSPRA